MKVKDSVANYKISKKRYTYQDYLEMPYDGKRYEIINGELIMPPAPNTVHARISKRIYKKLLKYSQDELIGEIFYSPNLDKPEPKRYRTRIERLPAAGRDLTD